MKIEIADYDPAWSSLFKEEEARIKEWFASHAIVIEHIGSTAIPQQASKPVIDIFTGVSHLEKLVFYQSILKAPDYIYMPTGMKNRYLFARRENGIWTHNLHILPYDAEFYNRNEILFRDYLREHAGMITQYKALKKQLAEQNNLSIEDYTIAKTSFIQQVVDLARIEKGLPLQPVWEE